MDQIHIDYAQEALREFSIYAERIGRATMQQDLPKLVLYADGSGHIVRTFGGDIVFSGLDVLAKLLRTRNAAISPEMPTARPAGLLTTLEAADYVNCTLTTWPSVCMDYGIAADYQENGRKFYRRESLEEAKVGIMLPQGE